MTASEFLKVLTETYENTFDLYKPYVIEEKKYPCYGYFFSHNEKYVLTREAKLWEAEAFEHIMFLTCEKIGKEQCNEAKFLIQDYFEPVLVRQGEKNPKKNHMYSFLTVVIISEEEIPKEIQRCIEKYQFEKVYMFNFRGYSQGRLAAVDLKSQRVYSNRGGRVLKKHYKQILDRILE